MPIPKVKFSGVLDAVEGLFKAKTPPLIGMDISTSAVKMVELSDSGNRMYRIERYAIEPLPKDSVVEGNVVTIDWEAILEMWPLPYPMPQSSPRKSWCPPV
jgi:hypothetical protein